MSLIVHQASAVLTARLLASLPANADPTLQTVAKRGEFRTGIVTDPPPSAYLDAQER